MTSHKIGQAIQNQRGHTLAEMTCALVMGCFCMGALYTLMNVQQQAFSAQDQIVVMEQTTRTIMQMISRDLRMAGYNPARVAGFTGITYNPSQLRIQTDLNGDGTTGQANEDIAYTFNAATRQLVRTALGTSLTFKDIQTVSFTYLDGTGTPTIVSSNIRQVLVTVTARIAWPDPTYPANGGYRTFTLQSRMTPVNLGLPL